MSRFNLHSGLAFVTALLILLGLTAVLTPYHDTWRLISPTDHFQSNGHSDLPRVQLFIPMTKEAGESHTRFCKVLQSAIVNGWDPIIYNWDQDNSSPMRKKTYGLREILTSPLHAFHMDPHDLVLMMDGMDAWMQLSPETMARRFAEYGGEIVAGADKVCWPPGGCDYDFPDSPLPPGIYNGDADKDGADRFFKRPKYACAGTVIGPLESMTNLLEKWVETMDSEEYQRFGDDDQAALNMFLAQGLVSVDYYQRLFWTSASDADDVAWVTTRHDPDDPTSFSNDSTTPWSLSPALAHHLTTGEVPVVLHHNDHLSKQHLEDHWHLNWWASGHERFEDLVKERLVRGVVRFSIPDGFREEKLVDLCGTL